MFIRVASLSMKNSKTDAPVTPPTSLGLPADVVTQPWVQALVHENDRLRRDIRAATERTERLQSAAAGLARALTMQEVAETIVMEGMRALGAVNGTIHLLSEDGAWLEASFGVAQNEEDRRQYSRVPADTSTPLGDTLRGGEIVNLESVEQAVARYPQVAVALTRSIAEAWVLIPIGEREKPLGVITFGFETRHRLSEHERALATALAQQCALAIERSRLFDAERDARARADAANRAKMHFLAVMSHELRTPLNAIAGYAQLIEMGVHGPPTPGQLDSVARIQRSQRHLLRLINDVLSFVKIEAGHIDLDTRDVVVHEMLALLETLIAPQVLQRNLNYEYVPVDPAITVFADADKAQQILLNLLSNAAKFTEPGGTIRVSCHVGRDHLGIMVADTGAGIPADKLEAVFEPFVQLDAGRTRTHDGTGLGLAISRDLARAMGGELEVESTLGQGSTFVLRLPRKRR